MNRLFGLKQFRQDERLSTLLYDRGGKVALLVDAQLAVIDDCRSFVMEHGLKIAAVLDTTQTAGPGSAAARVCEEHRCLLARSDVEIGGIRVQILPTPHQVGRTAVSAAGDGFLFTGFAPWAELVASSAVAGLPDATVLLPSFDERGVSFSTLGHERTRPESGAVPGMASIGVEKYSHKVEERAPEHAFVDVREPEEFEAGHIPGARNIPLSELGFHLDELRKFKRLYLNCLGGRRAQTAAKSLAYLGFPEVINVSGGFQAWTQAGLKVEKK